MGDIGAIDWRNNGGAVNVWTQSCVYIAWGYKGARQHEGSMCMQARLMSTQGGATSWTG